MIHMTKHNNCIIYFYTKCVQYKVDRILQLLKLVLLAFYSLWIYLYMISHILYWFVLMYHWLYIVYKKRWHVDGVDQGKLVSFSILVGIALSDQEVSGCGNLFVLPGSHHITAPILADIGAKRQKCDVQWRKKKPNAWPDETIVKQGCRQMPPALFSNEWRQMATPFQCLNS